MKGEMSQLTFDTIVYGTEIILNTIKNQAGFILGDERDGTDTADESLAEIFRTSVFADWHMEELRAIQIVRQAALGVLDGLDSVLEQRTDL